MRKWWIVISFALASAAAGEITGAALHRGSLITWGTEIRQWRLRPLQARPLTAATGPRAEGGCIVDAGSPRWGIVVQEGLPFGELVLRRAPRFEAEHLDSRVQMHDCAAARLFGQNGILVLHRFAQLRFYTAPETPGEPWPYREIYSIYTPSRQGGMLVTPDGLIAGNYWMRRPAQPDLPWREFAINTWSETPDSALLSMVRVGDDLVAAQGHMPDARLARFSPAADPTQLWNEKRLGEDLHLHYPHALAAKGDFLVVGENAGPGSRLFVFDGDDRPYRIGVTHGTHSAFLLDGDLITVGPGEVRWWELNLAGTRRPRASSPRGKAKKGR